MMKRVLLMILAVVAVQVSAQDLTLYKKSIKELSSAKYQGRGYAENGANKAGKWIAREFSKVGANDVVCQEFTLNINTFPDKMEFFLLMAIEIALAWTLSIDFNRAIIV